MEGLTTFYALIIKRDLCVSIIANGFSFLIYRALMGCSAFVNTRSQLHIYRENLASKASSWKKKTCPDFPP